MPRDGSATRDRILTTALDLVIAQGFGATSVDAVITASGTSKGAFFNHFPTKQALADALVERYVSDDLAMLRRGLDAAERHEDPVDRAVAFIAFYESIADEIMAGQTGCLYASVLTQQQLIDDGASQPITGAVEAWREGYAALLRDAADRDIDVDALADHVFVTFEGAFLLARTTADPSHLRRQLAVVRALVEAALRR